MIIYSINIEPFGISADLSRDAQVLLRVNKSEQTKERSYRICAVEFANESLITQASNPREGDVVDKLDVELS